MKVEYVSLEKIIPYVNNPKQHPDGQIKKIASSIKEFGFKVPVVVDKDFVIIAGHGRYEAAKLLGLKEVPVIVAEDLTQAQAKAFRIADNKVAESTWGMDALIVELEQLSEQGYDLELTGFDEVELANLLNDGENPNEDLSPLDEYEPRGDAVVKVELVFYPTEYDRYTKTMNAVRKGRREAEVVLNALELFAEAEK
ncbi:MAG: ParB N-terminal domain-containing protein [Bacillaceae bacterium]|nr:ParB N-terminal domain-containing protein [Bacillaceae bacterium]